MIVTCVPRHTYEYIQYMMGKSLLIEGRKKKEKKNY